MRAMILALLFSIVSATAGAASAPGAARYEVTVDAAGSRWAVHARLPVRGRALGMDTTRPFGVAELDSLGWPGLVRTLAVRSVTGSPLAVARAGDRGWMLARPESTEVILDYEVDLAPLTREGWPAPREAAWRDSTWRSVIGRALFVTTDATRAIEVEFRTPAGWSVYAPWPGAGANRFGVRSPAELCENLLVLAHGAPPTVRAGGFRVAYFESGWWRAAHTDVDRALRRALARHTAALGAGTRRDYLVLLLPQPESGGESYRASFALNSEVRPDATSRPQWANLVAHEIFHQWNGWQLHGADYSSTQWFQEGFTEYMANLASLPIGPAADGELRERLAEHVRRARRLATTLEDIGTRKGAPLYSAGALVAFAWDARIRAASGDRRSLADFWRRLLEHTRQGEQAYAWSDLEAALEATAPGDWADFHARHIRGPEPLPVAAALALVGQRLIESGDSLRVEPDPAAPPEAARRWRALTGGRANP